MNTKVKIFAALLGAAGIAYGCAMRSTDDAPSTEAVASSEAPIEGGRLINNGADDVSSLFPLSTVHLLTPVTAADGGITYWGCTGSILSPTQILTAAHCTPNRGTLIYFYPTPSSFPSTCSSNGVYADFSVVTLSGTIPAGYRPVVLGPSGQFSANFNNSAWAVGTGLMNFMANGWDAAASSTTGPLMEWVAARLNSSDSNGSFMTPVLYGDPGDSGGPMYQWVPSPAADAGSYRLILVGVLSSMFGKGVNTGLHYNTYSSVEFPANLTWIQNQIVTPPAPAPSIDFNSEGVRDISHLELPPPRRSEHAVDAVESPNL